MAKKLVSFRLDETRLEELKELANVYTNGNCTKLIEIMTARQYFERNASQKTPRYVYTQGRVTKLKETTIKDICDATGIFYNTNAAFNINAYWG